MSFSLPFRGRPAAPSPLNGLESQWPELESLFEATRLDERARQGSRLSALRDAWHCRPVADADLDPERGDLRVTAGGVTCTLATPHAAAAQVAAQVRLERTTVVVVDRGFAAFVLFTSPSWNYALEPETIGPLYEA